MSLLVSLSHVYDLYERSRAFSTEKVLWTEKVQEVLFVCSPLHQHLRASIHACIHVSMHGNARSLGAN
jgi:hypothetical protein